MIPAKRASSAHPPPPPKPPCQGRGPEFWEAAPGNPRVSGGHTPESLPAEEQISNQTSFLVSICLDHVSLELGRDGVVISLHKAPSKYSPTLCRCVISLDPTTL